MTKFISKKARKVRRLEERSEMIWAIIASEFVSNGRRETSSFQGLVTGKICIAETIASASGVLNRTELVTTGTGPRMRPSWLIRSAEQHAGSESSPAATNRNETFTIATIISGRMAAESKPGGEENA